MALPYKAPSQRGNAWFRVGFASSFPNIIESGAVSLSEQQPCGDDPTKPGCKVFLVPDPDGNSNKPEPVPDDPKEQFLPPWRRGEQVLVFQYKGKFHAVENKCPHSSYPLSNGVPFDIEDFGIALSAGINCPKHGWSFDLFSGNADRGAYKLKLWEAQLRPPTDADAARGEQEVWVRKKPRMG